MQKLVMDYLNEWKEKQRKRRRTGIVAVLLVVMVAGGIISSLTEAGIAMTGDVKCGKEEHAHTDRCYENVLICGQEESEGHQHSDTCYQEEQTLVCGQEESEEHQHTDACYQTEAVLICGTEESGGHTHTDACYEKQLVCGMEEHSHSDVCYIDEEAGVEESSEWDAQYADTQWTESWNENLVMAAEKQLGYEEVKENYITTDEGVRKGYTRYGQFAGNAYMDWDAAFVNFCIYYSKIAESALFPQETDSEKWIDEFVKIHEENGTVLTAPEELGVYIPEVGDIIFFHREGEETGTQMGIVSSYNKENNQIKVIEGNYENSVRENTYDAGNEKIATYLKMAELEQMYKGAGSEAAEETQTSDKTEADDVKETESEESPKEETEDVADSDSKADEKSEEQDSEDADDIKAEVVPEETEDENAQKIEALLRTDGAGNEKESRENLLSGKMDFGTMKSFGIKALLGERASDTSGDVDTGETCAAKPHTDTSSDRGWAAQIPIDGSDGKIILELEYGNEDSHDKHCPTCCAGNEEGVKKYLDAGSNGYMVIYADGIDGDMNLDKLAATIHIPAEYVRESTVGFGSISDNQAEHTIDVKKSQDGTYYELRIEFENYQQTGAVKYEFHWKYLGQIIPVDYKLKVYATLECLGKEDATYENVYRPEYEKPSLTKYVNSNQNESMKDPGTKVSTTIDETTGEVNDTRYASFWYKMGGNSNYTREYKEVILTDILPTYERYMTDSAGQPIVDDNGERKRETVRAVFDEAANPNWTLSEDKTKVTYHFYTNKSCTNPDGDEDEHHMDAVNDLKKQIEDTELKLRFPGCIIDDKEIVNDETGEENFFLVKQLLNKAEIQCIPNEESDYERTDEIKKFHSVSDDLLFKLTTQPTGAGFGKSNSYDVITDTKIMRETPYEWRMELKNTESVSPMKNITITDYELDQLWVPDPSAEGGKRLDERNRLKIHSLQIMKEKDKEGGDICVADRIAYVEAYKYDCEAPDIYYPEAFKEKPYDWDWKGSYEELELGSKAEYMSFKVHMKSDYELNRDEKISVRVYTVFRNPEDSHYDRESQSRNLYHNGALAEYQVDNDCYTAVAGNQFELQEATENIWIEKQRWLDETVELKEQTPKAWLLYICGILDEKDYDDIRIVDLLPESWDFSYIANGSEFVEKYETVNNYNNSGRTALILHLNAKMLKEKLSAKVENAKGELVYNRVQITCYTTVSQNASLGTDYNYAYLLSKDFGEITDQNSDVDIFDVDGDGDRTERLRNGKDYRTIIAEKSLYAEKLIAPSDREEWRKAEALKTGLNDEFRYKLRVNNTSSSSHAGLEVYDVLPKIGDRKINNENERGSEYRVQLSQLLNFDGYTVYYTNSESVYSSKMSEVLPAKEEREGSELEGGKGVKWYTSDYIGDGKEIEKLEDVTAIWIVANQGVVLSGGEKAEFVIPVKAEATLTSASEEILQKKEESYDAASGTVTYLDAKNTFGYLTTSFSAARNLESNSVISKVPFAGFVVKKTKAGQEGVVLPGAQFKLEKQENGKWEEVSKYSKIETDSKGLMKFRNLQEGTYRLTEEKAPEGYYLLREPLVVEITLNRSTMEYTITMKDSEDVSNGHAGNNADPFIVENIPLYELPSTGGIGIYWYMFGGVLLMIAALLIAYRKRSKGVLES